MPSKRESALRACVILATLAPLALTRRLGHLDTGHGRGKEVFDSNGCPNRASHAERSISKEAVSGRRAQNRRWR